MNPKFCNKLIAVDNLFISIKISISPESLLFIEWVVSPESKKPFNKIDTCV